MANGSIRSIPCIPYRRFEKAFLWLRLRYEMRMSLPPLLRPPAPARHRRAAVHHLRPRAGDRAMQGGDRRRRSRRSTRGRRPQLDEWLHRITEELAAHDRAHPERPAAPFAVNQIVHRSNDRLEEDLATCAKWKVPIVITSLGAREDVNHGGAWLGRDHPARRHQRPLRAQGDREGRGRPDRGRRGRRRPCRARSRPSRSSQEIRAMVRRAARAVGRDRHRRRDARGAGDGRRPRLYRLALHRHRRGQCARRLQAGHRRGQAADIVYSNLFTGVHGNYLRASIDAAGSTRTICPKATVDDELRRRQSSQGQGVARHLGIGPGHRRGRRGGIGRGACRSAGGGV